MPRHLDSDAQGRTIEILIVQICSLATPQQRRRVWDNFRGKTELSLTLVQGSLVSQYEQKFHVDKHDKLAKFSFSARTKTAKALLMDLFGLTGVQLEVSSMVVAMRLLEPWTESSVIDCCEPTGNWQHKRKRRKAETPPGRRLRQRASATTTEDPGPLCGRSLPTKSLHLI